MSESAQTITDALTLERRTLRFGEGEAFAIDRRYFVTGVWDAGGATPAEAEVCRVLDDPGPLLGGQTLCVEAPARLALRIKDCTEGQTPEMLVFSGKDAPKGADSPGLCGTFNYTLHT